MGHKRSTVQILNSSMQKIFTVHLISSPPCNLECCSCELLLWKASAAFDNFSDCSAPIVVRFYFDVLMLPYFFSFLIVLDQSSSCCNAASRFHAAHVLKGSGCMHQD